MESSSRFTTHHHPMPRNSQGNFMGKTKISTIIEAGLKLEMTKTGFTISELMSTLGWAENQKQYVRNIMSALTKKGRARNVNNSRPVVYSFKTNGTVPPVHATTLSGSPATHFVNKSNPQPERLPLKAPEDIDTRSIPLAQIEDGVFRHDSALERRIHDLEAELAETKRHLVAAQGRITEQVHVIERQNRIILGQKREKPAPVTIWKRRSKG